jgi:hypothetical protein
MMIDRNGFGTSNEAEADDVRRRDGDEPDDATLQASLAALATRGPVPEPPTPAEFKWRMTILLFPSILLVFVAFYVTSLASGTEPEVALFRAGGASIVLAVLARVAVGILGDESRLVLNDNQIVAMARTGPVRDYLSGSDDEQGQAHDSDVTRQPTTAAQTAGTGGKE